LQKTLKRISKRVCKNKTSGASVVQNVKYEESIHAYLMKCVVINHQKGEIEREIGLHLFLNDFGG
jgi:hypothetical protein